MVSVMMPVLAPQPIYFREAVSSLLTQTLTDIELIIVEDPSENSAEQLIAELADPRIRYFRNPKRTSLVDQRNKALSEARAEFVACLDADDVALPDRLQKQLEFMTDRGNVDVLGSQLLIIDASGRTHLAIARIRRSHEAIVLAIFEYHAIAQVPGPRCARPTRRDDEGAIRAYSIALSVSMRTRSCRSCLVPVSARFADHPEPLLRFRRAPKWYNEYDLSTNWWIPNHPALFRHSSAASGLKIVARHLIAEIIVADPVPAARQSRLQEARLPTLWQAWRSRVPRSKFGSTRRSGASLNTPSDEG